ncbi:hypothetical protein F5Y08DRAFT_318569 [Xylaria arbuscula]|nr:hypothetical protein F5Y08DRAFT_318569 [Xylaria arbuscula]
MDGLSLAASVVAVIQLAGSCLKLARKWVGPSQFSSTDISGITTSLYGFTGSIKTFQTHIEVHEDDEARLHSLGHLKPVLGRCEEALCIIKDFVEKSDFIGKHLIGPKFDRKLKTSLKALEETKGLFILALHSDQQTILLGVERYVRNLTEDFRDFQDGMRTSLKRLHENGDETYREVKRARKEQEECRSAMTQATLSIEAAMAHQILREDRENRSAILNWLTPIDYAPQQIDFISRRQTGTGQWFLDSPEFKMWLQGDKQTLFCPGIPGAGKTIMTSIVIDELMTRFENAAFGIAYIYCNFRRKHEQSAEDLLAGLLKQLVEKLPSLPESLTSLYNRKEKQTPLSPPSFDEISTALHSVTSLYSRVFIIVDALVECQAANRCREKLLDVIFRLQAECRVSFFSTARFIPEITEMFDPSLHLEIRASAEDVERYVEGHIEDHMSELQRLIRRSPQLMQEIKIGISCVVDGMFLLAQIYLGSLNDKLTPKAVRKALTHFKQQTHTEDQKLQLLTKAYDQAMNRINGQELGFQELAKKTLSWITCAKRPLTKTELQHALAVEIGESKLDDDNLPQIEDMLSACAGLVTIDEESDIIRLVHYTTQEYFEQKHKDWFPGTETEMTIICITYLSFSIFDTGFCESDDEFEERLLENPFYNYATNNWGHHARMAPTVNQEVFNFLECEAKTEAAGQAMMAIKRFPGHLGYSQEAPNEMTRFHLAAYFGLEQPIKVWHTQGHRFDVEDGWGRTPLSYAAEQGHEAIIAILLTFDEVDPDAKDHGDWTPLMYAAHYGHKATAKLLLESRKVFPDSEDVNGWTALTWAAEYGHDAIVKLLLDTGLVDVNWKSADGRTPLSHAAGHGHKAVVELLLGAGNANVNSIDAHGQTSLHFAVKNGHKEVAQKLLMASGSNSSVSSQFATASDHKGLFVQSERSSIERMVGQLKPDLFMISSDPPSYSHRLVCPFA